MKTHELKLNIEFCDAVLRGIKTFEIRKNDKDGSMAEFFAESVRVKTIRDNASKAVDNFVECLSKVNIFFKPQ